MQNPTGDELVHTDHVLESLVSTPPYSSRGRNDAQFYFVLSCSKFTWVIGTRLAIIVGKLCLRLPPESGNLTKQFIAKDSIDDIPFSPPTEVIAA